jgi:hypothetical protein
MSRAPLPPDEEGNSRRLKTFTFDEADTPMLISALSIAITTAMMEDGKESVNRLKYYKNKLKEITPPAAEYLRRDADLCEIAVAAATAKTWSVHFEKENRWSSLTDVIIMIGDRKFRADYWTKEDKIPEIVEMLERILPLTCERVERKNTVGGREV